MDKTAETRLSGRILHSNEGEKINDILAHQSLQDKKIDKILQGLEETQERLERKVKEVSNKLKNH